MDYGNDGMTISNELIDLLKKIFVDMDSRPQIGELMNHPWMKSNCNCKSTITRRRRRKFRRSVSAITTIPEDEEGKESSNGELTESVPNKKHKRRKKKIFKK